MENQLRQDLKDGKSVDIKINVAYPSNGGARPNRFEVTAYVDGKRKDWSFEQ